MIPSSIRRPVAVAIAAPLLGLLVGCSGDVGGGRVAPTVRDSAGITIVENPAEAVQAAPEWRIVTPPFLDIGAVEGSDAEQLYRVVGAGRLPGGRIAVANAGTHEFRFYGPDGELLRSVGGEGEGPGEFRSMSSLHGYRGDSLVVDDWRLRRAQVFGPEGGFGRSVPLDQGEEYGNLRIRGILDDSTLLVRTSVMVRPDEMETGVVQNDLPHLRLDPQGSLLGEIGELPEAPRFLEVGERTVSLMDLPFGVTPDLAVNETGFFFGTGERYEVELFDFAGRLQRLIKLDVHVQAVTPDDLERYRTRRLGAVSESRRPGIERMLERVPFPDSMPAYDALEVDEAGNLWVRDYVPEWEAETRWIVFDPDGAVLGTLRAPRSLEVHQIGDDFVLGTLTDELDVEHLRLYRLEKGGGTPGSAEP